MCRRNLTNIYFTVFIFFTHSKDKILTLVVTLIDGNFIIYDVM